jgi:hypothetical protein
MTNPAPRNGAATRRRWLALFAVSMVLLAGCEFATGTVRTVTELRDAGIRNPNLQFDNGVARLEYDSSTGPLDRRAEQDRAAEVMWRNLPFRVDEISVRSRGDGFLDTQRTYPRPALESMFGPRPAGLDREPGDVARRALLWVTVGGLLVLLAVVLIIVLVVRAVRRRPSPPPAGYGQPSWGPGSGQQPPTWPGYGQQGPSWTQRPGSGQQPPAWTGPPGSGQQGQGWPRPGSGQEGQGWPQQVGSERPAEPEGGRQRPVAAQPDWQAPTGRRLDDDWPVGAPEPGEPPPDREEPQEPPGDRGPVPPG